MVYLIGVLVYFIMFGLITKYVAESKGYEGGFWWGALLGIIGLLVVGFRPDKKQSNTDAYHQSTPSDSEAIAPRRSSESNDWICIKCQTHNPGKSRFCQRCGEKRHYDWICGNCGETNPATSNFCFNCGNGRKESDEKTPECSSSDKSTIEGLLSSLSAPELEVLAGKIKNADIKWIACSDNTEQARIFQQYGLTRKSTVDAPKMMSEEEARSLGYTSWELIDLEKNEKRYFKSLMFFPDLTHKELNELIASIQE